MSSILDCLHVSFPGAINPRPLIQGSSPKMRWWWNGRLPITTTTAWEAPSLGLSLGAASFRSQRLKVTTASWGPLLSVHGEPNKQE